MFVETLYINLNNIQCVVSLRRFCVLQRYSLKNKSAHTLSCAGNSFVTHYTAGASPPGGTRFPFCGKSTPVSTPNADAGLQKLFIIEVPWLTGSIPLTQCNSPVSLSTVFLVNTKMEVLWMKLPRSFVRRLPWSSTAKYASPFGNTNSSHCAWVSTVNTSGSGLLASFNSDFAYMGFPNASVFPLGCAGCKNSAYLPASVLLKIVQLPGSSNGSSGLAKSAWMNRLPALVLPSDTTRNLMFSKMYFIILWIYVKQQFMHLCAITIRRLIRFQHI